MSSEEPTKPYIYQPFGSLTHKEMGDCLFGIGGLHTIGFPINTEIKGITRKQAEDIIKLLDLSSGTQPTRQHKEGTCELCGTPVKVVGDVTKHYEPIGQPTRQVSREQLAKAMFKVDPEVNSFKWEKVTDTVRKAWIDQAGAILQELEQGREDDR